MSHQFSLLSLLVALTFMLATADLKSDLHEFSTLIPRRRIGYIAARHYVLDQRFRHSLDYVRSPKFRKTWRQIRESSEFQRLVDYLTQNTTEIQQIDVLNHLRSFQLPTKVPMEMLVQQRNLGNFLKDAVRALPRNRIANLMAKKVTEAGDFAKLYQAANNEEFRQLLEEGKQSENLTPLLEEFAKNSINVDEVIEIGFKVLKWGP